MDIKFLFFILAFITGTAGFIPYLRDIFGRRTQPHLYTWIIWAITQGTAAAVSLASGGGFGAYGLAMAVLFNTIVFLLAFRYGTKNITKSDTVILIAALLAIVVWWQLHQPLLAVVMVTVIDFVGYVPTFRKSWSEPYSETVLSWLMYFFAMLFSIFALKEFNKLTLIYPIMVTASNLLMVILCVSRRPYVHNK